MPHFTDDYADSVRELLHQFLPSTFFFKQEIVEVEGLLTALLVTYDGVRDDMREGESFSWEEFLARMSKIKNDWAFFDRTVMERFATTQKVMCGWEGQTIYVIRGGNSPDQWTTSKAIEDMNLLLVTAANHWGKTIRDEVEHLRDLIPVGVTHFREYERFVRVIFNFLFRSDLGPGMDQSRTEPEQEGVEIRDIIFANTAQSGFWRDLKDKYGVSEVVVDAKNTDDLTRDDLRQLYCYLKPALGYWGIIVCRQQPSPAVQAFNRTLFKNFAQQRGVLILADDDLKRMVAISNRGHGASEYLRDRMSEFVRGI